MTTETTNQPDTTSNPNPNPNPINEQHAVVTKCSHMFCVDREKFTRDDAIAPFYYIALSLSLCE